MRRVASPARERSEFSGQTVYDGRIRLGEMFDLGGEVSAQLVDGTELGTFRNIQAATQAIIEAARA